jgi:hypothetical protein
VPVRKLPNDTHLSLIPSTQAYTADSEYLHLFISLPLIPYELSKNSLFQSLKERDLIIEITDELIESTLITSVLLADQFIAFLHWLSSQHRHDKAFIKRLLSMVRFRETNQSAIITLEKLKSYDNFNIPSTIMLPGHVLPARIAVHLSQEELQKQLSLSAWTLKEFLSFYLLKNQQYLFTDEVTSTHLLSILSKHSGQMTKTEWTKCQMSLAALACIPTIQGMKIPNQSYIPSSIISSDLPIITLNIPSNLIDHDNNDDIDQQQSTNECQVSIDFLKRLGCRTVNVQSFVKARSLPSNTNESNVQTMKLLIENLMEERDSMSQGDFDALKQSECLRGNEFIVNPSNALGMFFHVLLLNQARCLTPIRTYNENMLHRICTFHR